MNKEAMNRLREAKKYEIMAIKALFPEQALVHLDVIKKEIKEMMSECVIDMLNQEKGEMTVVKKEHKYKSGKNVKKINIG